MATFPEKVKHARSELGLTQAELGEATGVSLRTILDYEKGKKVPRQATLLKLARALKVSSRFLTDDSCDDPMTAATIPLRILPGTATSRRPAKATVQRAAVKSTPCSVKA